MKPTAALYARISPTPESAVGANYSIPSQIRALQERAAAKGYYTEPALAFIDDNFSGENLNRPQLTRLRELVRQASIDVVLCYSIDRLGRNTAHLLLLRDECARSNVRMEFINTEFESTPEGKLMFSIQSIIAEFEREKIRERTKRGTLEKVRQGYIHCSEAVFGYTRLGQKEGSRGELIINEREAASVRRIFEACIAGHSTREIALTLNADGLLPREAPAWTPGTVRHVLRNPVDTGRWRYNVQKRVSRNTCEPRPESDWVRATVPRIVTDAEFEAAAQAIERISTFHVGRPSRKYLLRGLARCARCKRPLYAYPNRGRAYYRCGNFDRLTLKRNCDAPRIWVSELEAEVWDAVEKSCDPDILAVALADGRKRTERKDAQAERQRLERMISNLKKRETRATRMLLDQDLESTWSEVRADLKVTIGQRRQAERELQALDQTADQLSSADLTQACAIAKERIRNAKDWEQRRAVVTEWVHDIRVDGDETLIKFVRPATPVPSVINPQQQARRVRAGYCQDQSERPGQ